MRIVTYKVPVMTDIHTAAHQLVSLAVAEQAKTPDDPVKVVAWFNGIEISAASTSIQNDVAAEWDRKRCDREVQRARIYPVDVAVRYLLSTLSDSDRIFFLKELMRDPLSKEIT